MTLSYRLRRRYLNFTRDMPLHSAWIEQKIQEGIRVTLVGPDLAKLMSRIQDPIAYARSQKLGDELKILIIVTDHRAEKGAERKRRDRNYVNFVQLPRGPGSNGPTLQRYHCCH